MNFAKPLLVKRLILIIIPFVLLCIIYKKTDFNLLVENLKNVNVYLIILGIGLRPLQILLGSLRWQRISEFYTNHHFSTLYMIRHYWSGMAIGFFTPGNIGWDAYRILTSGAKLKAYTAAFLAVISEKFIGLLSILTMVLLMFPLTYGDLLINPTFYLRIYLFLSITIFIVSIVVIILLRQGNRAFWGVITRCFDSIFNSFLRKIKNNKVVEQIGRDKGKSRGFLSIFKNYGVLSYGYFLSIAILMTGAMSSQLIFQAMHCQISFLINLFAASTLFIIFFIPFSFGSIGVRETAYILVYGLFGVPVEYALLVSFFNLFGLFFNIAIGAGVIFLKGMNKYSAEERWKV